MRGADVFIGVSTPGSVTQEMVRGMARDPIVFACANPVPEIFPDEARAAGAKVVATGRSDFPNQINNVLAFPGIFRGDCDPVKPVRERTGKVYPDPGKVRDTQEYATTQKKPCRIRMLVLFRPNGITSFTRTAYLGLMPFQITTTRLS